MSDSFPRIITLLRTERKLTQKEAAELLDVSQALLSHYEHGRRECGLDFLCKAADLYGVSCDYLLGRTADRNGAQITVDDIPEPDTNNADKRSRGSAVPVLNKKLIANTLNILFDLLQKCDCRDLTSEASAYIMIAVYKVFRLVYLSNPKNSRSFFSVPDDLARGMTTAALEITESRIAALAAGKNIEDMVGLDSSVAPELSDETLKRAYPLFASSLLNLMRNAEQHIGVKR
ncbi:MAG: helix-turn-helix domain-containing protein [Ruminococcaceae bacterium]|nr:helix-turn-helix domain-containing protein [Oscillospiraceae bacterium]